MISAGNDIVSLSEIDINRTLQPAFYSKILSESEQQLFGTAITDTLPFEHYVWLLWSAKESAYKFLKRLNQPLVFSPTTFIVKVLSKRFERSGETQWQGQICKSETVLYFQSKITPQYIHSAANHHPDLAAIRWDCAEIDDSSPMAQSQAVRALATKAISAINPGTWEVVADANNIPSLSNANSGLSRPLSLSHHGLFVAYSF